MDKVPQVLVDQEMNRLMVEYPVMNLGLTPFEWVSILGMVQLALRHPGLENENKHLSNLAGAKIQAMLAEASDFIGQMVETGWHPELDEVADISVSADLCNVGFIELTGDGDAIWDVSYSLPANPDDERWNYELFLFGVGSDISICHVFWDTSLPVNAMYRLCLGLRGKIEPLTPREREWLAVQND